MFNIKKIKTKIYLDIAKKSTKITHINKYYYTKLRYIYHDKMPASLSLLLNNDQEHSALNCLLFIKTLPVKDNYQLVIAKSNLLKRHIYIECEYEIIDPMLGIIVDKKYFDTLLGIHDKKYVSKNKIQECLKEYNIGNDSIYDCIDTDTDLLEEYKEQAHKYSKRKQQLINEHIDGFINDVEEFNKNRYAKIK